MEYARQTADGIELLSGGTIESTNTFELDGELITQPTQVSYETMVRCWSDAERAVHGIYPVVNDEIPAGKMMVGSSLEMGDAVVYRRFTLADAPPPSAPMEVSDLQFRLALNEAGLRTDAETYIAAASQDVKDWWDRALRIRRDDPFLLEAVAAIGKAPEELDAVMTLAATFNA